MDYRNAAGKNWDPPRTRRRTVTLGQGHAPRRLPETLPAPGQLEHRDAAGRNWTRERPKRARRAMARDGAPPYPVREAAGGDRDCPYRFQAPSAARTFPFTARTFGRLLVLRGRVRDGEFADDLSSPRPGRPHKNRS